jgi:hypothetical protein
VVLSPRLLSLVQFDEDLIGGGHQVVRIREIVRRQGNAPQQFGKDLGPIAFLQGVELVEELLSRLRHVTRVPSSGSAVKGTADHGHLAEQTGCRCAQFGTPGALSIAEVCGQLWTTGVHDYAETRVNTRLSASNLFHRITTLTS